MTWIKEIYKWHGWEIMQADRDIKEKLTTILEMNSLCQI